jgi:hypothetical protein
MEEACTTPELCMNEGERLQLKNTGAIVIKIWSCDEYEEEEAEWEA